MARVHQGRGEDLMSDAKLIGRGSSHPLTPEETEAFRLERWSEMFAKLASIRDSGAKVGGYEVTRPTLATFKPGPEIFVTIYITTE